MTLKAALARLVGVPGAEAQDAANRLAGTTYTEMLGALNVFAGTEGRGLHFVCNKIAVDRAGRSGLDAPGSLNSIGSDGSAVLASAVLWLDSEDYLP